MKESDMDKQVEQKFRTVVHELNEIRQQTFENKKGIKNSNLNTSELQRKVGNTLKGHSRIINKHSDIIKEAATLIESQEKRIRRLKNSIILLLVWNIILTFVLILS